MAELSGASPHAPELSGHIISGKVGAAGAANHIDPGIAQDAESIIHGVDEAVRSLGHINAAPAAGATSHAASDAATAAVSAGQHAFSWSGYIQALGILLLLLALIWILLWLLKRYGRFNFLPRPGSMPRNALYMEAQLPLGPRKGLMVVRFLNKRLLIGVTDHQISLLAEEKTEHEARDPGFAKIMEDIDSGAASGSSHSASS